MKTEELRSFLKEHQGIPLSINEITGELAGTKYSLLFLYLWKHYLQFEFESVQCDEQPEGVIDTWTAKYIYKMKDGLDSKN